MRLLALVPCDRIINDVQAGPSLISAFQSMNVQGLKESMPPADAVIPRDWAIFSTWFLDESEKGPIYTQKAEVFWPDGTPFTSLNTVSSHTASKDYVSFAVRCPAFPVGQAGLVTIKITLFVNDQLVWGPEEAYVRCNHIITEGQRNDEKAKSGRHDEKDLERVEGRA